MFASLETDGNVQIDSPQLGMVDVTIRTLSGRSLEKARLASTIEQGPAVRSLGGEVIKALQSPELDALAEELKAKKADPKERYKRYDRFSTLVAGIKRWSCQDKVELSPKAIEDLKEPDAQKIFEAIIDRSDPAPAVAAAVGKDGSGASISS
jgi:hypothetical protein